MAQILVRDLEKAVVDRLKARAKKNGRSLQAEVKMILQESAKVEKVDMETARAMIDQFRLRLKGRTFSDSVELIREGRDQ
jgi:plasmid stability protein